MSGPKNLKKGDILFKENDSSDSMYVIKSGKIAITKVKGESEIVLAELKPGDMLGEMAFFDNRPRSAGARALADSVVIELPFKALNAQFKTFPEWLKAIVRTVNNHLRNANTKIKQLEKSSEEDKQFFPPHMMTRLVGILAMVTERFGGTPQDDGGIEIPAGTLRRFTIQIFQQPTSKMQKLMEILQDMSLMKIEDLGEGRQKLVVYHLDQLFAFVEFYNDYLFKDESKRITIEEKELKVIKGLIFYGKQAKPDDRGRLKLNLTQIKIDSAKDLGYAFGSDDILSLVEKGVLPEALSEDGKLSLFIDLTELERVYPHWNLVYTLKRVPARD